jgi:hypothetical protein
MTTFTLRPPLHIGARLMPALRVSDTSTIHISPTRRDPDGRVVWRYIIEDHDHHVLDDATDLRSGTGDDIDPHQAMATLLAFLTAAAEAYRHTMNGQCSDNIDLFPPDVTEWAYQHDEELAALALELTEPDTPEPAAAERDVWHQVWAATGCADCAGAAVEGRPFGPDHCWATHRPHTPIAETNDEGSVR